MRYFLTDVEPTQEQLDACEGTALDAQLLGQEGYFVAVGDDTKPEWLGEAEDLNVPGEPHRCPNCGEVIG